MADRELAAKLAKRLACTEQAEDVSPPPSVSEPPPAPIIPIKIVENPYVAVDNSFSVDDLILKTLEQQESPKTSSQKQEHPPEENNNSCQKSLNPTPPPSLPSSGPTSPSQSVGVPPKINIKDLLLRDQPQPVTAVPKNPVVPIEHHKPKAPEVPKKKSPEVDGTELERKLAAQRAKRVTEVQEASVSGRKSSFEELEEQMQREVEEEEKRKKEGMEKTQTPPEEEPKPVEASSTSTASEAAKLEAPTETNPVSPPKPPVESKSPSPSLPAAPSVAPETSNSEEPPVEPANETAQKEATKKSIVPSPLLMEAIQKEFGVKSPPPPTAPKPQTPTHSRPQSPVCVRPLSPPVVRPQSPVVKKLVLSPLGLLCDPLMSVESPMSPKLPQSPKVIQKPKEENPEELAALLDRRNKIIDGEEVPQFVNRKLSLYAEFSEFSRKQVKFFSDTFKKYDEDGDGFIDFNELKRMMEKLGEAQTHIALKEIIKKVDEDLDGKINLREFFLLFRLAAKGELGCSEVFTQLAESVDVAKEGVLAAASFFQAKIAEQTKLSKFEEEIKQEQEDRKREEEEKKQRREQFLQKKSIFH